MEAILFYQCLDKNMKDADEFLKKYPEGGCIKLHDGRVACFISHEVLKEALVLKTLERADFVYLEKVKNNEA